MTNITTMRPGEHFMFKNFEWVCLDPNHPDGGVLAIMAKPWAKDVKFCPSDKFADEKGNLNNYRTSNVRGILSDMANAVFAGKGLLPHTVDLVADNGDRAYGTVQDFVFSSRATSTESTVTTSRTTTAGFGLPHRGIAVMVTMVPTRSMRSTFAVCAGVVCLAKTVRTTAALLPRLVFSIPHP